MFIFFKIEFEDSKHQGVQISQKNYKIVLFLYYEYSWIIFKYLFNIREIIFNLNKTI